MDKFKLNNPSEINNQQESKNVYIDKFLRIFGGLSVFEKEQIIGELEKRMIVNERKVEHFTCSTGASPAHEVVSINNNGEFLGVGFTKAEALKSLHCDIGLKEK
jgi:hypothetical protein